MKKKKWQLKMTRRQILKAGMIGGAGMMLPWKFKVPKAFAVPIEGGTLSPGAVTQYASPLVIPPAFKFNGKIKNKMGKNATYYEIAVQQFQQQILPAGDNIGMTTVWSYGPANKTPTLANGYFYPAFTIENKYNSPTVVKWVNGLGGLEHLLPVDPALHWANPIGRRDTRPNPTDEPGYWDNGYIDKTQNGRYTGPVPMVVHVHGAHTTEESDGYPEAWWLPAGYGSDPDINWTQGRFVDWYKNENALDAGDGYAVFEYPNDQPATTLWYHDHTLGMTRLNVYAGPAGFWLIRGGPFGDKQVKDSQTGNTAILPQKAPGSHPADPFGTYYEIPIAIQDRSFNNDGSLFYPDHRAFFEGLGPDDFDSNFPFIFDGSGWGYGCEGVLSDVARIWQPEFFGNMMVVNGQTWPYLNTERRRYRFRLLNGCNSRFLILQFSDPKVEVWQIGAEQGFLPAPVKLNDYPYPGSNDDSLNRATILMGPAERADIIVDFTNVTANEVFLKNLGPDEPFGGGTIGEDFDAADSGSTGQVMKFNMMNAISVDDTTPPQFLQLPQIPAPTGGTTRNVSLNEEESASVLVLSEDDEWVTPVALECDDPEAVPFGPTAALLGNSVNGDPRLWADLITENPANNSTETWNIYNFTADAHPIHVHLVKFNVVNRQALETDEDGVATTPGTLVGSPRNPEPWETGPKDTVIAYPGEVTRIIMHFDLEGFYVWHCHIVEHEDNEMMRPYHVGDIPAGAPAQ